MSREWISEHVRAVPFGETGAFYKETLSQGQDAVRWLARRDRFFLLTCLMEVGEAASEWCFERCREVEAEPDGRLDLWSRFHWKSTIITLAGSVQEILRDPEITIGILSYNRRLAEAFVDQIRRALESPVLTAYFPDVLHARPPALNWGVQKGLTVRRRGNPKEPTVYGSGLVDGQPVGAHFALRIYDDVVVPASVTTPEQIAKTTEAWELSLALGTGDGGRAWHVGTRYHPADTYSQILARGAAVERRHICEDAAGRPTMMKREALDRMKASMGPYVYAAQMLQDPVADGTRTFRDEWWNVYFTEPSRRSMRVAVLVDSANSKRRPADYTTQWVVGWCADGNHYLLDGVHDRLNLSERTDALFGLVRRWRPERVFWEQVGAMSDAEHVRYVQDQQGWHFPVTAVGQQVPKADRIRWLQPTAQGGRIWFPSRMLRRQADGETRDLMRDLFDHEFRTHPVSQHDDMLDCLANIHHPEVARLIGFPKPADGGGSRAQPADIAGGASRWNPLGRYQ